MEVSRDSVPLDQIVEGWKCGRLRMVLEECAGEGEMYCCRWR